VTEEPSPMTRLLLELAELARTRIELTRPQVVYIYITPNLYASSVPTVPPPTLEQIVLRPINELEAQ
jgi:hypothetical protein